MPQNFLELVYDSFLAVLVEGFKILLENGTIPDVIC